MPGNRTWTVSVAATILAGCALFKGRVDPAQACRPVAETLAAGATTAGLAGTYAFTMVATSGARAGRSVTGRLELVAQDSALVAVEGAAQTLRGTSDVVPDSVGAVPGGDLVSTDPRAPGVALYEHRAPSGALTVFGRLGSGSNARGPQPFDAAFTTLFVRRISDSGFAGGWRSSAGSTFPLREAEGYFCAARARS